MTELTKDYVELYPARILLEVDTFEAREHSLIFLLECFKGIEWKPLPLVETTGHNLN